MLSAFVRTLLSAFENYTTKTWNGLAIRAGGSHIAAAF
jgi:hypothetical protein